MRAAPLLILLLAGCASPSAPFAEEGSTREVVVFHDCLEHHAFFAWPASAFEDRLPTGFELVSDGATTTMLVAAQVCKSITRGAFNETHVGDVAAYLSVVPPPELRHENFSSDLLMLSGLTSSRQQAAWASEMGFGAILASGELDIERDALSGGLTFIGSAKGHEIRLETTSPQGPGSIEALEWRAFVAPDRQVVGVISHSNSPSDSLGLGQSVVTWSGEDSPLAVSAWLGGDHALDHVTVTATFRPTLQAP